MRPFRMIPLLVAVSLVFPALSLSQRPPDTRRPDLVVSSFSTRRIDDDHIEYSWTITNVGAIPANLDGPTGAQADNVSVQVCISKDPVFMNGGDEPSGGTIIGLSPLGLLSPHASRSGSYTTRLRVDPVDHPYLVIKADWGAVIAESNEDNNTAAVGIAH
jgi:hypothetical protein